MKKKQSFTLIEMMISLTLFGFIITSFFYWSHAHLHQAKQYELLKWPLVEERYVQQRLEKIFSKIIVDSENPLLIEKEKISFSFDNGVDQNSALSNKARAVLSLKGTLWECTLLPSQEKGDSPQLKYPLLDEIISLRFSCYHPKDPLTLAVSPDRVMSDLPEPGWQQEGESKYMPAFITIEFERYGKSHSLFFDLDKVITHTSQELI